ncbi:MAG: RNA methyltransferase [Clostridia bacterium]|nr:RNA methyltransferase [Clostridia bacterium]
MQYLSSHSNQQIIYARSVRDEASVRRSDGVCFAEGLRLCRDALEAGLIRTAFVTEEFVQKEPEFVDKLQQRCTVIGVSGAAARSLADTRNPQGVFCVCDVSGLRRDALELNAKKSFLCLDRVCDPGNMGTVLRTAEAFGGDTVLVGGGCCDIFSPKVLRASMGACFRVGAYFAENLAQQIARLSGEGVTFYAAMLSETATDLRKLTAEKPFGVVIGNEANGVSDAVAAACEAVIIPMSGGAESLNAAGAATIFLWELFGRG